VEHQILAKYVFLHCSALFKELLQHVHSKERLEFFLLSNAKFRFFTKELRFYESKDLYQHTKPDGLCSLRACLLAVKFHVSTTLSLPPDINIEDSDQRQHFIQLLQERLQDVNIQLDHAELLFVNSVISRLQNSQTDFFADHWPTQIFLEKWIPADIPWSYWLRSETNSDFDELAFLHNISFNFNSPSQYTPGPYTYNQLLRATQLVKSRIKWNSAHFYLIQPLSYVPFDLYSAVHNLHSQLFDFFSRIDRNFLTQFQIQSAPLIDLSS
jgi:hypothetical protein